MVVRYGDQSWTLTAADLGVNFDASSAAAAAYEIGRRPGGGVEFTDQIAALQANLQEQLSAYRFGREVLADEAVDRSAGLAWLEARAREINRPVAEATLRIDGLDVVSTPSQTGYALDVAASHAAIYEALLSNQGEAVELAVKEETPLLADVSQAEVFMRQILSGPVVLTAAEPDLDAQAPPPNYAIPQDTLVNLTSLELTPQLDGSMQLLASLDVEPLRAQVQEWAAELAREPRDARLDYDPKSGEIKVVTPSQTGRVLDVDATLEAIRQAALSPEHNALLPLTLVEPAVNMHKVDEMGIVELVATGTTSFKGSSADRVHNIATAANAVDNTVVPPGGVFSFNNAIGDVNAENGYTDSLIIWGDRTAIGIGGGVCQVSTTAFRAAFYGGFPIEERWNHGYVVGWYGQPGLDATIYTPTVDFKFRNTTDHHIIIKADMDEAQGDADLQLLRHQARLERGGHRARGSQGIAAARADLPDRRQPGSGRGAPGRVRQERHGRSMATGNQRQRRPGAYRRGAGKQLHPLGRVFPGRPQRRSSSQRLTHNVGRLCKPSRVPVRTHRRLEFQHSSSIRSSALPLQFNGQQFERSSSATASCSEPVVMPRIARPKSQRLTTA